MSKNDTSLSKREGATLEPMGRRNIVAPPVDIYENADEILVVADVPGARTDGITVRLEKDELTLHAATGDPPKGEPLFGSGRAADYARRFVVPPGIDGEKITADLKAGVLKIHLPKSAALKPRRIQVRAS